MSTDDTAQQYANILRASGYFRVSHRYRIIARVDNPGARGGHDYYRRCLSKDKVEGIWYPVFRLLESSHHASAVGYLPLHPRAAEVIAACKQKGEEDMKMRREAWRAHVADVISRLEAKKP